MTAIPTLDRSRPTWVLAAAATLLAIVVAGTLGAFWFIEGQRAREERALALRLGSTADARAGAIGDWVARQVDAPRGLAENQTLQLYLSELAAADGDRSQVTDEAAQIGFVRSLLAVAADRLGFAAPRIAGGINANVMRGAAGIGFSVLDPSLRILLSTGDPPALEGAVRAVAERGLAGPAFDLVPGPGGRALFIAASPVAALQGESGAAPVGVVFGLRDAEPELFQLLDRPPMAEQTAQTLLLRRGDGAVDLLSPLRDGTRPFGRRIGLAPGGIAETFAVASPAGFAILPDLRDIEVVIAARAVPGTNWTMALKIDRAEALGEVDSRLRRWLILLSLGTLALGLAVIAVWRHGASERASAAAAESAALARRFAAQSELLRSITDSQSARIFIVGQDGRVHFTNRRLCEDLGESGAALEGKRLGAVFGPAGARRYEEALRTVMQRRISHSVTERTEQDGAVRVMRSEHVPVTGDDGLGMLVVEEDITQAVVEREKRARILQEVVDVLVRLVDLRDPFAANHSKRVAAIAREIAVELDLDDDTIEATETAGRLMNLGKALVPEALLTRQGRLTDEEHAQVREALRQGIDMLDGIEFGGPVVETLRQAQERWDGTGPNRLAGEAILMSARVIAVANAFVAMTSPRAHRPGAGLDEAMAQVQMAVGKTVDRRVVAALVNLVENRGGRTRFASPQDDKVA
jgi:PAS domain S-box-containing protein